MHADEDNISGFGVLMTHMLQCLHLCKMIHTSWPSIIDDATSIPHALMIRASSLTHESICRYLSMSRPQGLNTFFFATPEKNKPQPGDKSETANWMQFAFDQNLLIKGVWKELFQGALGGIPGKLTAARSGQFAVTRDRIRAHPRGFYQVCPVQLCQPLAATDLNLDPR